MLHTANVKFIFSWWNYRGYIYNKMNYNSPPLNNEWEITVEVLVSYDNKHSCFDAANAGVCLSNSNDTHRLGLLNQARRFPLRIAWQRKQAIPLRFPTIMGIGAVSYSYSIPSERDSGCHILSTFFSPHWIRCLTQCCFTHYIITRIMAGWHYLPCTLFHRWKTSGSERINNLYKVCCC